MNKKISRIILLLSLVTAVILYKYFNLSVYLNLNYLKENHQLLLSYFQENKVFFTSSYFLLYILVTTLSLPGATILTLAGGAIFGLWQGFLIVSFASTIGATLAFLSSKFLFKNFVENKFKSQFQVMKEGVAKNGSIYLLSLRLIPVFPFFMINLIMGLTGMNVLKYFVVSQIGMIPGTLVYVNAGVSLGTISNLKDILSLNVLGSFILLGILPLMAKLFMDKIHHYKIYRNLKKPKTFDYNMIAIGGGSAGLVTAYISSAVKAKVALIEKHQMGGDCLNTGCVPSKAILKSAKIAHQMKNASKYGLNNIDAKFDFKSVIGRVHNVISKIQPHDSVKRYESLGVDCFSGQAKIISPWEVQINGKVLKTKNITIATGASPIIPKLKGIENITPLTSNNLWQLESLPSKFIIVGGGPIGCEMAQAFSRLGSKVSLIEMGNRLLISEDNKISEFVLSKFNNEGIEVLLNHSAVEIKVSDNKKYLMVVCDEKEILIEFDQILFAIGRRANTQGFGLEEIGVELRENKTIKSNDFMQTNFPNIFVCGDVTGPYQLTHTAAHQAWYCAVNGLFGKFKKFRVDYSVIPWATYTDPEVASVGLNENRAKVQGISYELVEYEIDDLDRAIADSEDHGFVRVLVKPGTDKILGATIVGNRAGDLITEFITAMKYNIGLEKILGTIHIYPTMSEANKYLAGNWKKKNTSPSLLAWLEKFHSFMRR